MKTYFFFDFQLNSFGDAPPGNPNILFAIINGPSADSVNAPSALLRKYGIKVLIVIICCNLTVKKPL